MSEKRLIGDESDPRRLPLTTGAGDNPEELRGEEAKSQEKAGDVEAKSQKLSDVLDQLVEKTDGESLKLDDLLDALDSRCFGPLLLVISVLALSPIGTVPGMSIITGTLIVLLAVQMFFTNHPWLPKRLLSISFSRDKLTRTVKKIKPWITWMEKVIHARLVFLVRPPFDYLIAIILIALAVSFYPLAVVPFGVAIPSSAAVLFSLGLTSRDGVLVLIGFGLTAAAAWALVFFWPF